MRFHHLDLNLLVALDALLREQSITRAAERLNISQSAASGHLAKLRDYFTDELLVSAGRRMIPTALALELAEPVRLVLLDIQSKIVNRPAFEPATCTRHFKVIASDFVTTTLLAPLTQYLQQHAPHISLDILPIGNQYNELLSQGDVDFVIMPGHYLSADHPKALLFEDQYNCVLWRDNPLVGDSLSLEQYLQLGHVAVSFGNARAPSFEEEFARRFGKARRVEVTTSNFNTLPHLLIGTHRVAIMQSRLSKLYAGFLPLKVLDTPISVPPLMEYMQWNDVLDNDPAHRWMREVFKEIARQH
ncbi:LysR family transcriptional regulator [Pseudomonas entomophila]|uniref:LysR family transcriptional regulator n=1 Tax=Pseudomonas entomophila TaxID=312306 RepID=UPI0023D859C7|nr:LysR family transcriptional regulator [Pseudomonas entomophila]MDF0729506.1 LysR family transcriptional regulator [Pseudomonas entomophila]